MPLKNVIFDLDGTLVDSLPGIEYSVDFAFREARYPARTGSLRRFIGPPIRTVLQNVSGQKNKEALDRLESSFRRSYDSEGWRKTVLNEGTIETLGWLASVGCRLYLVTNKPHEPTSRITESLGLTDYLVRTLSPDSAGPSPRSKAQMIKTLMAEEHAEARNSLVVGDTPEDCEAAAAAGVHAAILTTGYGSFDTGPGASGCHRIQTLFELKSVVAEIGGFA